MVNRENSQPERKCNRGGAEIRSRKENLLYHCGYHGIHQRSGLRGRTSTALDRFLPVCAIGPEVGFTRSGLDRSGLTHRRHVITKEEFPQSYLRSNLRLHSIQLVLL